MVEDNNTNTNNNNGYLEIIDNQNLHNIINQEQDKITNLIIKLAQEGFDIDKEDINIKLFLDSAFRNLFIFNLKKTMPGNFKIPDLSIDMPDEKQIISPILQLKNSYKKLYNKLKEKQNELKKLEKDLNKLNKKSEELKKRKRKRNNKMTKDRNKKLKNILDVEKSVNEDVKKLLMQNINNKKNAINNLKEQLAKILLNIKVVTEEIINIRQKILRSLASLKKSVKKASGLKKILLIINIIAQKSKLQAIKKIYP
ncbi:MAG: hypothetical protein ACTSVC_05450 [Promethearchaeota archaeon]